MKDKTPFALFRAANKLTLHDVAEYLDVPFNTISKISTGDRAMSEAQRQQLISNPHGWNVTALLPEEKISDADIRAAKTTAALINENRELRRRITALEQEKEEYWQMIKNLSASLCYKLRSSSNSEDDTAGSGA